MKRDDTDDEYGEDETAWGSGTLSEHLDSESETEVECPYCGETVEIVIDKSGGATQDYVQDCEVCCRPWKVHVSLDVGGVMNVRVEQTG